MQSNNFGALLLAGLAGLLFANYVFAHSLYSDSADRQNARLPTETADRLPSALALRSSFLNFDTMATDIAWIWTVVQYGKHSGEGAEAENLEYSAKTIADLDPKFYDVYPWFSATYLKATYPPSVREIQKVNNFLDRGMTHFPTDYRLPYEAGLNYIGYSKHRTDRERVQELSRGIEYLQRASRLENAPDRLPLTVSWMYQRRRQLQTDRSTADSNADPGVSPQQVEFLAEMYFLLDDPNVRQAIERKLANSSSGKRLLAQYDSRYRQQLERKRAEMFPYLPRPLWSQLLPQTR